MDILWIIFRFQVSCRSELHFLYIILDFKSNCCLCQTFPNSKVAITRLPSALEAFRHNPMDGSFAKKE